MRSWMLISWKLSYAVPGQRPKQQLYEVVSTCAFNSSNNAPIVFPHFHCFTQASLLQTACFQLVPCHLFLLPLQVCPLQHTWTSTWRHWLVNQLAMRRQIQPSSFWVCCVYKILAKRFVCIHSIIRTLFHCLVLLDLLSSTCLLLTLTLYPGRALTLHHFAAEIRPYLQLFFSALSLVYSSHPF